MDRILDVLWKSNLFQLKNRFQTKNLAVSRALPIKYVFVEKYEKYQHFSVDKKVTYLEFAFIWMTFSCVTCFMVF